MSQDVPTKYVSLNLTLEETEALIVTIATALKLKRHLSQSLLDQFDSFDPEMQRVAEKLSKAQKASGLWG